VAKPLVDACLDEETVSALVSGDLNDARVAQLEAHIASCDRCLQLIADAARASARSGTKRVRDGSGEVVHASADTPWVEPHSEDREKSTLGSDAVVARQRHTPALLGSGSVLAQRFRVERFIARGGMGEVFEAEDTVLRTRVALKTLRCDRDAEQQAITRFMREVALSRTITHRNVCRVFDMGVHTDASRDLLFMTMELLEGKTLSAHIEAHGPLSSEQALPIVQDICAGLSAAHALGIVHRDLKSSNVILHQGRDGQRTVVTDFGLARLREGQGTLTQEGQLLGTPATMAPEQVTGDDVTVSTDVYALGCVMFEMLTGSMPFTGSTPFAIANRRLTQPAPALRERKRDAPVVWEQVIARCLEREPARRYQRASEVAAALVVEPERRRQLRGGVLATVAGLVLLALVLVVLLWAR
jgi:serine/threonine protein kinase